MIRLLFFCFLSFCFSGVFAQRTVKKNISYYTSHAQRQYYNKQYSASLAYYDSSFVLGNTSASDYYNAACSASLAKDSIKSFRYLSKSIDLGYIDAYRMNHDPDLENLRRQKTNWLEIDVHVKKRVALFEKNLQAIAVARPDDIIPYCKNKRWGYFNKKSGKVLMTPLFEELSFVSANGHAVTIDGSEIFFSPKGEIQKIISPIEKKQQAELLRDSIERNTPATPVPVVLSSADGFRGFRLDGSKKNIIAFSDLYNSCFFWETCLSKPFRLRKNYYVVAIKNDKTGIIDSLGNPLPHFNFEHDVLNTNFHVKNSRIWFYCFNNNTGGFVNDKGVYWKEPSLLSYPFYSTDLSDYNFQKNNQDSSQVGVFDNRHMKWVLKPISEEKLFEQWKNGDEVYRLEERLYCSFREEWQASPSRENIRDLYLMVHGPGGQSFFVDMQLNRLWPAE